ncbi:MAG: hypothetical protein AAGL11_02585 [Pseudomonadota bacterium]
MGHLKALAISLGFVFAAPHALACSCMPFESAQAQLDSADLVFEGQVINVAREKDQRSLWQRLKGEPASRRQVTTFQVYQSFKGDPGTTIALTHLGADRGGICGIDFNQTEPFVVLAYESSDGTYSSSLCTQAQFSVEAFRAAAEVSASE